VGSGSEVIPASLADPNDWNQMVKNWVVANLIALVALVQPYLYWTWKKYFRKGRIDLHQTGQIEVGYSGLGSTIALIGTLRAVHEDQFVHSIDLLLTRTRDNMQRKFEWAALRPLSIIVGAATQPNLEIASGFMLLVSAPLKFNIVFKDPDFQAQVASVTAPTRGAWETFWSNNGGAAPTADVSNLFFQFRDTLPHVNAYAELDRMLDWQPVEYSLDVRVNTANPKRTFTTVFRFSLNAEDVQRLRFNCFRIIEEACGRPTTGGYDFRYCNYVVPK